jgi:hypothetical protein
MMLAQRPLTRPRLQNWRALSGLAADVTAACPNGASPITGACCGAPGTPAIADPCSEMNVNPSYNQIQAAATEEAIATVPSYASFVSQVGQFSQQVQDLVTKCYYSPGGAVQDDWTNQPFNCPSNSASNPAAAAAVINSQVPAINVVSDANTNALIASAPAASNPYYTAAPATQTNVLSPATATQGPTQSQISNAQTQSGGAAIMGTVGSPAASPVAAAAVATCPSGQTCSILPGIPDNYLYIGGAAILGLIVLSIVKK